MIEHRLDDYVCDKYNVNDVNRYLYGDGIIRNKYIIDNISYDTVIPCEKIKIKRLIRY